MWHVLSITCQGVLGDIYLSNFKGFKYLCENGLISTLILLITFSQRSHTFGLFTHNALHCSCVTSEVLNANSWRYFCALYVAVILWYKQVCVPSHYVIWSDLFVSVLEYAKVYILWKYYTGAIKIDFYNMSMPRVHARRVTIDGEGPLELELPYACWSP